MPTMELSFYTVDAFTPHPFSGNPAAVCPLEDDISDNVKQSIATEMNISETCFITKVVRCQVCEQCEPNICQEKGKSFQDCEEFGLRWFTPTNEVPLCGHATLAAATVLFRVSSNL